MGVNANRKLNWPIWAGFIIVVAGLFSYEFFARFPMTRDFPWANLLLFGIGIALLIAGLVPCVRPTAGLPRKDFRIDHRRGCFACCRVFQLRNLLRPAAGAGLRWRSARGPEGA